MLVVRLLRQGIRLGKYNIVRMPCSFHVVNTFDGSFDSVSAALRAADTSLRMTNNN